ncbi:unnamed protein product [Amoebophrya sp. A120]|nr:unnamed protein product [Amoebophrya sp. A120]|eukprot:GSA120T00024145001.1
MWDGAVAPRSAALRRLHKNAHARRCFVGPDASAPGAQNVFLARALRARFFYAAEPAPDGSAPRPPLRLLGESFSSLARGGLSCFSSLARRLALTAWRSGGNAPGGFLSFQLGNFFSGLKKFGAPISPKPGGPPLICFKHVVVALVRNPPGAKIFSLFLDAAFLRFFFVSLFGPLTMLNSARDNSDFFLYKQNCV